MTSAEAVAPVGSGSRVRPRRSHAVALGSRSSASEARAPKDAAELGQAARAVLTSWPAPRLDERPAVCASNRPSAPLPSSRGPRI